jgi:hypothetical protein
LVPRAGEKRRAAFAVDPHQGSFPGFGNVEEGAICRNIERRRKDVENSLDDRHRCAAELEPFRVESDRPDRPISEEEEVSGG